MSILTAPLREADLEGPGRVVLRDLPWDLYVRLRDVEANRRLRMSYLLGVLEIMSPQFRHEKYGRRSDHLVMIVTAVLGIPCASAGSTTFRREDRGVGKEPDSCFYIEHEHRVRDKDEIDLAIDPPPDLAIEVDNLADSRTTLPIYSALAVPEVWRYDVSTGLIWFGRLQADGAYSPIERSQALPILTPERVQQALGLCRGVSESLWIEQLRDWVRGLRS